jgi:hypothetical protein
MVNDRSDVLQGTLDMLVLRALQLEPMHGWGIASSNGRSTYCNSARGRSIRDSIAWNVRTSFVPIGALPTTIGAHAITR